MRTHTKKPTAPDFGKAKPSIKLLVSGFARQSRVSVNDIAAIIDAVPAGHLARLDMITYDPDWETDSALTLRDTCPKGSKAVYLRKEHRILVFDFDSPEQFRHILYHEIGHHVFERVLSSYARKRWVTIINPHSRYVTRYAARNAAEDFAESYAVFLRDPKRLELILRKYTFLRDEVFEGIAINLECGHLDVSV